MIEWPWCSVFTLFSNVHENNLGYFLDFCNWSSLSIRRFRFFLLFDADNCGSACSGGFVNNRLIDDCSRLLAESCRESGERSDTVDWEFNIEYCDN